MLKKTDGFSLVELLIAIVVLIVGLLVIFEVIVSQKKFFKVEHELIKMTQNTRASVDILLREFRMAGYKTLEADFLNSLQDWISSEYLPTSPSSVDLSLAACPIITQGEGTEPDMITLFMADTTPCSLLDQAYSGDITITLDPNSPGFSGSTKFRMNDLIRIGDHTEFAKVVSVSPGSPHILTIDTDPAQTGTQGLAEDQNPGRVIREINVITYTVFNDENDPSCQNHSEGHPVLKRKYNEAEYLDLAEDIEDFQIITQTHPNYKLQLTTRTSAKADYREGEPDRYKRSELLVDFRVRNFQDSMCLSPATPAINSVSGLDASRPCEITLAWSEVIRDKTGENLSTECAVSEYIVAYDTTAGEGSYTAYPGDSTSCTIDVSTLIGDSINPSFYLSVAAVNGAGVGAYAAEETISDSSPPAAITDLTANAGENSILVNWTGSPECDVQKYRLYRSTSSGGPYPDLITTIPESGEGQAYHYQEKGGFHFIKTAIASSLPYSYQDNNVVPCITYYYIVRAYDNTYESADSNEAGDAINDNGPPRGPTNFSFTIVNDTVNLSWTLSVDDPYSQGDGDGDVIGYFIYALSDENEILLDNSFSAGENSVSINTQGYTDFGIKAVDSCNNSSDLVTQPESCPNPPTVTISSHKSGDSVQDTVTLQGTASSSNPLSQVKLQIDLGEWTVVNGTTDWSYVWDTSSMDDGTYNLTVMAIDDEGCSGSTFINLIVENDKTQEDLTPPSFGSIVQNPGGEPVEEDKSVEICVRVTDGSGISSVILTTNFSETITMTDPDLNDVFCGTIPAHNESDVTYTITATDDSDNHNQASVSSGYTQAETAPLLDTEPPIISTISFTSLGVQGSQKTIQINLIITDDSGIASAIFVYSGLGGEGNGVLSNIEGDIYQGTYQRHKNKSCTVTVCVSDKASPPNSAISDPVSDEGI